MYSLYRRLSPYVKAILLNLGFSHGACRFRPTCSAYTKEAYAKYGLFRGTWLSGQRLLKCHPWSPGGLDPVL